jgi:hypothetical protein
LSLHGQNLYFAVEDSAGSTLRDISIYVTQVDLGQAQDIHDNTTAGQTGHTYQGGLQNNTITVNGFWDKTASTGAATVLDSLNGHPDPVAFEFGPEGDTNGNVKYSGDAVFVSVDYGTPVADLVTFSAQFQVSGSIVTGVFA